MSPAIPTPEVFKAKAKIIRKFLKEKCQVDLSSSQSLELISQVFDFKDWNTASAASKLNIEGRSSGAINEKEKLIEALLSFKDSSSIDFEYSFRLEDLLENLDSDVDDPEDTIHQTFAISSIELVNGVISFHLGLTHEEIYSADEKGVIGRTLRYGGE